MIKILKKNGREEDFDFGKIRSAVGKSASRVKVNLNKQDWDKLEYLILKKFDDGVSVSVLEMHNAVESALDNVSPKVAESYRSYRNYKNEYAAMMAKVLANADELNYKIDKSNANTTAALVSTKRSLIYTGLNKERYKTFELNKDELEAIDDGYIYIHDLGARSDTYNCFSRDTKFLTTEGLRSFADFNDGDMIYVPDADGVIQRATVRCYGRQLLNHVEVKRAASKTRTINVTANHRWLLKDGTETTSLKVGDHLKLAPTMCTKLEDMTEREALAWSHGFILAEGTTEHYYSKHGDADYDASIVRLCGEKIKYAPVFLKAGLSVTYPKSYNGDGMACCRQFIKKTFTRDSFNNYDYAELKAMAYGYMCADGNHADGKEPIGQFRGVQCSGKHNEWLADLLTIGGFYITNIKDLTGQITNFGARNYTLNYRTHDSQGCRGYVVTSVTPFEEQDVWCLEVENSHSFILEGGIPTGNCCLFDMGKVLQGGFEWEHIGYNEPKDVRTACNLISDITLNCAAQQYGGFTIPEIDSILAPYARKSYKLYRQEYLDIVLANKPSVMTDTEKLYIYHQAHEFAMEKVARDVAQGFQGFEHTFNTVASSRGDFPFVTMSGGCEEDEFGQLVWKTALKVRREGQGHPDNKRPAIFPKLVFLYTKELHGEGKPLYDLYKEGVITSSKAMYPDWLSLDIPDPSEINTAYVMDVKSSLAETFNKYHKFGVSRWFLDENNRVQENPEWVDAIVSPMGCRAYLSPLYQSGGFKPVDDKDRPVFHQRFNGGAVSLNLPMIYRKAQLECEENTDLSRRFFTYLGRYCDMIDGIHTKTYLFLSKLKASCNPVAFCEGGFGNLNFDDDIKPLVDRITFSYGFTALNELQRLATGESLYEVRNNPDSLALRTEKFIADYVEQKKRERTEGKVPYIAAIYATPRHTWEARNLRY